MTGWGYFFYRVRCALWLAWVRLVRWGTILRERGEAAQEYYQRGCGEDLLSMSGVLDAGNLGWEGWVRLG